MKADITSFRPHASGAATETSRELGHTELFHLRFHMYGTDTDSGMFRDHRT